MVRLGLRLAVAGGREALARLALIVVAVAVGVTLLLTTLATLNAVDAQNSRYAWLQSGYVATDDTPSGDPLWWMVSTDHFAGERIGIVDVAPAGPDAPVPPGITTLPGPGEMYASPALADLLAATPPEQLADRIPATVVGVLGDDALPAPDSLLAIVGHDPAELATQTGAQQVRSISTTPPSQCDQGCAFGVGLHGDMTLTLSVVVAALLAPVLIFIGGATRLSAARREQRFAAMRLVGATPRQIAVIATVESTVAALAGTVAGFGLFAALRPAVAQIPFTGESFFTADVSLGAVDVLLVALGIPIGAAIAARLALRRVNLSPLGVTRHVTPQPPRAWRLLPLAAGVAELAALAYLTDIGDSTDTTMQAVAYLTGILLIVVGLVVAGPWLTMWASRRLARRAARPATLIAGRRLADDPRAGFRAISGLVLAVFVGTCAIATITTVVANRDVSASDVAGGATLVLRPGDRQAVGTPPPTVSDPTVAELLDVPGVTGVVRLHLAPVPAATPGPPQVVASCADLAGVPSMGRCPDGAATVTVMPHLGSGIVGGGVTMAETTWPPADLAPDELSALPSEFVAVGTDGSTAAVERARTVLSLAHPSTFGAETLGELDADNRKTLDDFRRLATIVILASLPIAGCSLAVGVAGGLADRRRPFSLLRLAGTPMRVLRGVVLFESAVPLLVGAAVAGSAGLLAAALFVRAQLDDSLTGPGGAFYAMVALGLLAALGVIASTLPLLRRMTGPDAARNE